MKVAKVILVDDHRVVAEGMSTLIATSPEFDVLSICGSGEDLLALLRSGTAPDVCVLDLSMPGIGGVDVLRILRHDYPAVNILVVSAAARPEVAARCLREGADGFLSKFHSGESFMEALEIVSRGGRFIDPVLFDDVVKYLASAPNREVTFEDLSGREFSVMLKVAQGMTITEIASEMNLNAKTVSTYRTRVLKKLQLRTNAELTAFCLARDLITIESA